MKREKKKPRTKQDNVGLTKMKKTRQIKRKKQGATPTATFKKHLNDHFVRSFFLIGDVGYKLLRHYNILSKLSTVVTVQ